MADKKVQHPILVTPKGPLAYAWLDKKDTKFSKGDSTKDKYKGTVLITKGTEETKVFMGKLLAIMGKKALAQTVKDGDKHAAEMAQNDKDGSAFKGMWLVEARTKNKPKMIGGGPGRPQLPPSVKVWSGDIVKLGIKPNQWDPDADKWNFYLEAVKLYEKRALSGGGDAASAFDDDEEGYVADEETAGGEGQDSGTDNLDF